MKIPVTASLAVLMAASAPAERPGKSWELPSAKPAAVGMSGAKLARVDDKVRELIAAKRLAGASVMITRRGRLVYRKSFGFRDIEKKKPMEDDTIFRIFSMTKAITSAAALMLSEEGKLRIDDPISRHLPEYRQATVWKDGKAVAPDKPPTIRDLLCHTAGYSYGSTGIPELDKIHRAAGPLVETESLTNFVKRMAKVPMAFEPGRGWLYGISTDLLGAVVERASGIPLDQFFLERIFMPLGMHDTGFVIPEAKRDRMAVVYKSNRRGRLTRNEDNLFSYSATTKMHSGGGGLASTIRDYTRFLQMIANGGELNGKRFLKKESVAAMTRNHLEGPAMPISFPNNIRHGTGFGLGFCVKVAQTDWNKAGRLDEYGWGGMLSTHFWISPRDELVVVTMEQTLPYDFMLEDALKPLIYDAIE